jgi:hypothetical protein
VSDESTIGAAVEYHVAVKEVAHHLAQRDSDMGESAGEDEGRGEIEDEDRMCRFQSVEVWWVSESLRDAAAGCPLAIIGAVIKPVPSLRTSSCRTFSTSMIMASPRTCGYC